MRKLRIFSRYFDFNICRRMVECLSNRFRELLRIGVTEKCTLTEIPTALLITADAALTGLVLDV